MSRKLVIGNWKMNGNLAANDALLGDILEQLPLLPTIDVVVCPPFPYLYPVARMLRNSMMTLGAQNLATSMAGACTGETSGAMLKDLGARYVLIGHSERRALYGETNDIVARKTAMALEAGLTPVICVGETLEQRQQGDTMTVVQQQLNSAVEHLGPSAIGRVVIAYEPVWAIGTGQTASSRQAQEVHRWLRELLRRHSGEQADRVPLLYGGSVKSGNARELFCQADIDGGLVGGASLDAEQFVAICHAAAMCG